MKPLAVEQHSKKGYILTHECEKCGYKSKNKLAPDDDFELVLAIVGEN